MTKAPADTEIDAAAADRLRLALTRMARRLRQEAGIDIGPSQASALAVIERHGPLGPSELAEREGIRRPTATRIAARLTEAGLVDRVADSDDGRCVLLSLSPDGAALLRRVRSRKTAYLVQRLGELPPEDARTLERATEVLERMLEHRR